MSTEGSDKETRLAQAGKEGHAEISRKAHSTWRNRQMQAGVSRRREQW